MFFGLDTVQLPTGFARIAAERTRGLILLRKHHQWVYKGTDTQQKRFIEPKPWLGKL